MSFFKKFKDRFAAPNARITLQLNKNSFVPGENIEGSLAVTSDEDFEVKEIRCEFACIETKKRIVPQYDATAKRQIMKEVRDSSTLYSARPPISGALHMTRGFSQSFPLSINIPAAGRPTYHSVDASVSWPLKGVIAIGDRPDVTSNTMEIQVTAPTASPVIREKEILREVVMIPCKYCGGLMQQTVTVCPNCGAKRTG